ncbi:hypothetical protein BC938DRAFT_478272 [Jimgerdemannia flammicorona]|uniref:Uncharacterized protein n=1 Tax=Jimgerdemannia flammicorona TaxID=994334 RepID=A0A433QN48_9FUNG|nr:hypothetical protein BC938DRAFT_478272 [Jimgerdemannia flammicorona]
MLTLTLLLLIQEFIDILKEILADGFTAVKFFKRIRVFSSIRKEAEDALRQTLGTIGTEDNDLDQARSLLGNIEFCTAYKFPLPVPNTSAASAYSSVTSFLQLLQFSRCYRHR